MDVLNKLDQLIKAFASKKDSEKGAVFKKIVNLFVSGTSWAKVAKELSTVSKSDISAEKFGLSDGEFEELQKNLNKSKDSELAVSAFQKSICNGLESVLSEVEKDATVDRFEDVILPLLILATDLPLKYLKEKDPFGSRINFGVNDSFKNKSYLYASKSYESLSLTPSSAGPITRPFLIPILKFVTKSDRYITCERLKDVPFLIQCLRFAVHFEDPKLDVLGPSVTELAVKVVKAIDFQGTADNEGIFAQLNALTWDDNDEECTKAVLRGSSTSLVMTKEEVFAHLTMLRILNSKVGLTVHIKSCFRALMKNIMKSICYRKSPEDCKIFLHLLQNWINKDKNGPMDIKFVRMIIKDTLESYDSFLAKCPLEWNGEMTKVVVVLLQETLSLMNNLKSIKSTLESLFDRINTIISKSERDTGDPLSEYVEFLTDLLDVCEDSTVDQGSTPWHILFRTVFLRCFVGKMRMEWVEKACLLSPLYKKMSGLVKTVTEGLELNGSCDYMNECVPSLTETVLFLVRADINEKTKWECIVGLCDSHLPSEIIRSISFMKNQSARSQCASFIAKMVDPLTDIIKSHPSKTTLAKFESFFTVALTVDLPPEIRNSVCNLWKHWFSDRMEEMRGASMGDELKGRLAWFNLPIPADTINDKFEVRLDETRVSPKKKTSLFSSPAPVKKKKSATDALKAIDLMDEDSADFVPVESPKKKQRMTEKQKEMMSEKKDRLPFMEDESTTGIPKIPSDIFEMSVTGVDGSKSVEANKGKMRTDFSDISMEKKSNESASAKDSQKKDDKNGENKKKKVSDNNIDESASSSESTLTKIEGDEKRRGRRKSKTPMKMDMKKETSSPSRKKVEAPVTADSTKRKSRRSGKSEEKEKEKKKEGKTKDKKEEEEVKKDEDAKKKKEDSVVMVDETEEESMDMTHTPMDPNNMFLPKRSDKITLSAMKKGEEKEEISSDSSLDLDTPLSSQSGKEKDESSPIKGMEGEGGEAIPRTPANRGSFGPVGILSSSKKGKSEKKKGGVHFNVIDENLDEEVEVDEEEKRKEKEVENAKKEKKNKMVFPLLMDNEDSIDTILLKLGSNTRLTKISLDKIGVTTVGQLASCPEKEINGLLGIKPPKMDTVRKVLEGVWDRSQKSASKSLPPIFTPEEKKADNEVSPNKSRVPLPPLELSPIQRNASPPKSKSRKRLALDSPARMKKSKVEDEEENQMEISEDDDKKNEVIEEETKEKESIDEEGEVEKEKEERGEAIEEEEKMEVMENDEKEVMEEEKEEENGEGLVEKNEDGSIEVHKEAVNAMDTKEDSSSSIVIVKETRGDVKKTKVMGEDKENGGTRGGKEKPAIASLQDVISFISRLKGAVSLPTLLDAQEQVSVAFFDAIREASKSHPGNK